ncbi:efflux RND transporter permease subunit [Laceyella putida]|uniref:Efflux RND transporter permease subunit n=1 Tax=Laceyella putida TaxID=110101 RepID=A0ABW2RFI7_9BACL
MNRIIKWSLNNGTSLILLMLIVLFGGVTSIGKIQLESFPDVSFPVLSVQITLPGSAAEDIEKDATEPIEESLIKLKDYESLVSTSSENSASISITYPFGTDIDEKERTVESEISKLALPEDAHVQINKISTDVIPIYQAAVSAEDGKDLQAVLEDQVVPAIEQTEGVYSVQLKGKKAVEVEIRVNLDKAEAKGLDLQTIKQALQNQEYAMPAGSAEKDGSTIPVRMVGGIDQVDQLKEVNISPVNTGAGMNGGQPSSPMPAKGSGQSQAVKLSEIAEVKTVSEQTELTRVNGKEAYLIEVTKDQEANTADVAGSIRDILSKYEKQEGWDVNPIMDQGEEVEKSVSSLVREGLFGALFVIVVIALFLRNVRATLIALISLPLSILATISLLEMMGYTLNIMTLGGMAVAIGRIVDDSIVVIENIYRWRQQGGNQLSGKEVAYRATKEILSAVASSTFVTVVVFLPLAFVTGILGEMFRPFAIAVTISILVSLLVAMMLIPLLGASFFKQVKQHAEETALVRGYEKLLRGALKKKGWVMAASLLLLIASLGTIPFLGFAFLPGEEATTIQTEISLPAGTTLAATDQLAKQVDDKLADMNLFVKRQMTVGSEDSRRGAFGGGGAGEQKITFTLETKQGVSMGDTLERVQQETEDLVKDGYPEATVTAREAQEAGPPSGNNIDVQLYGENQADLQKAAGQIEALLKQNADLKNISNNMGETRTTWEITLNDEGEELGLSPNQVAAAVNQHLQPTDVGTYELDGKEQSIALVYDEKITSLSQLEEIRINTPAGPKSLGEIADVKTKEVLKSIRHENGNTYAQVSAQSKGKDISLVTREVEQDIQSLSLPKGIEVSIGGGLEDIQTGFKDLGIAIAIAIGLVFLILSMTYGGLLTPLVILSSLIFVPVGALTGLLIAGQSLSMSAMIGFLMLVGIVVTNAVVLLDRVEANRKAGIELVESLVEAAKTRLRPILMTAIATILALIPLALSGASAELISQGLAITVIGGLTTSTLLTLIFVPVLYALVGKVRRLKQTDLIGESAGNDNKLIKWPSRQEGTV